MHRHRQLGMRENPASDRRHGSRLAQRNPFDLNCTEEESSHPLTISGAAVGSRTRTDSWQNAAAHQAATVEEIGTGSSHLLTVHEVAKLLPVPASWLYGRTRRRCLNRLPAYRLGKYWRFREDEIHAWVKHQREGHHA